ncbi:acetyltransferase (GNAT) family domain-containing protein [Purpureocillium lilacinum]|uniref:Acetyltransferase (GNAT) family domain-containing protein n=1 Tax=Purpureocillium lilacinum TaxID=33203 RepID=A0A179HXA3_PURLI|nr:acetyltransferase (GNAT) family domain-containing protein [Purpureocillium lilacinum]OAQ95155.1 acetyltransferase (GNAT) family domain-containing protein [Purpureocillium lilacinum]
MAHSAYRIVPLVVVAPAGLEPGQDGNAAAPHPESLQQVKDNQDQCYYYRVQGEQHRRRLVDALVALHVACIQFDGALMRFHPPFGAAQWQRMRLFWDERVAQAEAGRRVVLLALPAAASVPAPVPVPGAGADVNAGGGGVGGVGLGAGDGASEHQGSGNHDANDNDVNAGIDIAGVVELATPDTDTGPFRADVEMLMVSPNHRRAGLGKRLMAAVEDAGRQRGRTLLQLSTTAGSVAEERLYPALGYTKLGTVPNYGISPVDGQLVDGVYFYKDLSRPPTGV